MRSGLRCGFTVILFFLVLHGTFGHARGAEWVYFATTDKGTHFYDKQSVKRTRTTVVVTDKTVYGEEGRKKAERFLSESGPYTGEALDHVLTVSEFNCKGGKGRAISMGIYDISGKRVAGSPGEGGRWSDIVPGSLYDHLSRRVCP